MVRQVPELSWHWGGERGSRMALRGPPENDMLHGLESLSPQDTREGL